MTTAMRRQFLLLVVLAALATLASPARPLAAATGIVQALRVVTFSPAFTAALHLAIRAQAARPWPGDAAYDAQVSDLYRRFPNASHLAAHAQSRTFAGR